MLGVILAAGKGTRLGELGENIPKTLLPVGNKTCLEHIILGMKDAGVRRVAVVIGHLGEMIAEKYGSGEALGVEITYLKQDLSIYGTARAVQLAEGLAAGEPVFVSYGDIIVEPSNYKNMVDLFTKNKTTVSSANWVEDPYLGAAVYFNQEGFLEKIIEKPPKGTSSSNWNNAGVYIFKPLIFDYLRKLEKSQRGEYELSEAVKQMIEDKVPVHVHQITGYWQDIGSLEDLARIRNVIGNDK